MRTQALQLVVLSWERQRCLDDSLGIQVQLQALEVLPTHTRHGRLHRAALDVLLTQDVQS